jgi:hypothetical protein
MTRAARTRRAPRWWIAYRGRVWWPAWVGHGARAWQGGVVAVFWPITLWALGSAFFWAASHMLRLLLVATAFGWLGTACCAAAAVLPFAGGVMLLVALFRPAPTADDRSRALHDVNVEAEV